MFQLSTTKIHDAPGSVATVCSMGPAKSASVRVGPMVGVISSPVVTSKWPMSVSVPGRVDSNSIRSQCLEVMGRLGAIRSKACNPVISSVLTVCVPWSFAKAGASR